MEDVACFHPWSTGAFDLEREVVCHLDDAKNRGGHRAVKHRGGGSALKRPNAPVAPRSHPGHLYARSLPHGRVYRPVPHHPRRGHLPGREVKHPVFADRQFQHVAGAHLIRLPDEFDGVVIAVGAEVHQIEEVAFEHRIHTVVVRPTAGAAGSGEGGPSCGGVDQAGQEKDVGSRILGHTHHPAPTPAVAKERLDGRAQVGVGLPARLPVPCQRQIAPEHVPEPFDIFDRYRGVERSARREADEGRHVHPRQHVAGRKYLGLEVNAG